ncbi:MAG: alpha/beta hydrolase [Pseudomonadota bacterium]
MRRILLLAAALVLAVAGCGGGDEAADTSSTPAATATTAATDDVFAYDAAAPLRYRDLGRVNEQSKLQVRNVVFAGAQDKAVQGFLVLPPGKGPFPAVIYLHGSGGDRVELLGLGAWLAARGAVALTIDSPFVSAQSRGTGMEALRTEHDLAVRSIVDTRRAVDMLQALPQVDDDRIGLVGFSAGARTAAVLAGVEHRISSYVLWSGGSEPVTAYTDRLPTDLRLEAGQLLTDVDPLRWIKGSTSALLFQDGRKDEVVPRAALVRLARAAPEPKELRWYPAGHQLDAKAYRDQLDWLTERLQITGPPVPGADTGPPTGG